MHSPGERRQAVEFPKDKKAAQALKETNAADRYQQDQLTEAAAISRAADIEAVAGSTTGDKT